MDIWKLRFSATHNSVDTHSCASKYV